MKASIRAHSLEEERLGLNAKLHAAQEAARRAARVALLRVEEEPVLMLELLLRDVSKA